MKLVDFKRLKADDKKKHLIDHIIANDGDVTKSLRELGVLYSVFERWCTQAKFKEMYQLIDVSLAYRAQAALVSQSDGGSVLASKTILANKGHLIGFEYDPGAEPTDGQLKKSIEEEDNVFKTAVIRKVLKGPGLQQVG